MIALFAAGLAALVVGLAILVLVLHRLPDRWLVPRPRGSLDKADYFAVFALGLARDETGRETPGATNAALADWLLRHNTERKLTVVQEGVYLALLEREQRDPSLNLATWVVRLPHDPERYATTAEATLQCLTLTAARGLSRPAVVAHPLHQQRMAWLFQRAYTTERVVIPELPAMPFDPASVQHWGTRSRWNWLLYELFLARPAIGRYRLALGVGLLAVAAATVAALLVYGLATAVVPV